VEPYHKQPLIEFDYNYKNSDQNSVKISDNLFLSHVDYSENSQNHQHHQQINDSNFIELISKNQNDEPTSSPPHQIKTIKKKSLKFSTNNSNSTMITTSPIIQQPQPVNNNNRKNDSSINDSPFVSSSSNSSSSFSNKNNKQTTIPPQEDSANPVNKTTNSYNYLDDENLKMTMLEADDILKLIKLHPSIDYQEWLAFNSNF
jgi:hypothetical protein